MTHLIRLVVIIGNENKNTCSGKKNNKIDNDEIELPFVFGPATISFDNDKNINDKLFVNDAMVALSTALSQPPAVQPTKYIIPTALTTNTVVTKPLLDLVKQQKRLPSSDPRLLQTLACELDQAFPHGTNDQDLTSGPDIM